MTLIVQNGQVVTTQPAADVLKMKQAQLVACQKQIADLQVRVTTLNADIATLTAANA